MPIGSSEKKDKKDKEEEQQENNGEEEEEEEENEEEENGITDANVKKLIKMDLADKEGIIDLLMKDNLVKKSEDKAEKIIKNKFCSYFVYRRNYN